MRDGRVSTKRGGGLVGGSSVVLSVSEGEIVSLIGRNGAGKTKLFAIIAGSLPLDEGEVMLNSSSINGLKPHKICQRGLVRTFQITQPFAGLTTLENIMVGASANTTDYDIARSDAERVAELGGMSSP